MIKNKNIAIFGFAKEGLAAANYLSAQNKIAILDIKPKEDIDSKFFKFLKKSKNIEFFLGNSIPLNPKFDLVVRSPGIKPEDQIIQKILSQRTKITSGTKIFFENCPAKIIGVTGTKGKGTTSTLIYEMLKRKTKNVFLAGNIGTPALEILPNLNSKSTVILELSSFQLIDITKSPHIAVVLMTTSEHLDWHTNPNEYLGAKSNLTKYQTKNDFAVVNADYKNSVKIGKFSRGKIYYFSTLNKTNGLYLSGNKVISEIGSKQELITTDKIFIPGTHNIQNIMAASAVAQITGVDVENIIKVIKSFKGLKHRLQLVGRRKGISFYNDSFSTTPETSIAALNAFQNPKIIILGGSSKRSDFSSLGKSVADDKNLKAVILIGEEAENIRSAIKKAGGFKGKILTGAKSMSQIISEALSITRENDVIILSPGCASFDMFKNYEDRGDQFINEVRKQSSN